MKYIRVLVMMITLCSVNQVGGSVGGKGLPDPYFNDNSGVTDTIPITDNPGDFITNPNNNPFDITPSNVTQTVEYDPVSGQYIIMEKIGEEYYRTPSYMTFSEYMNWKSKQQERDYFDRLGGFTSKRKSISGIMDPMEKIDIKGSLVDKLFGGKEVNIQPQGQVDVIMQSSYYNNFTRNNNSNGSTAQINPLDPDVKIKVSVDGNIGEKLNLSFNYDTQSTFDFDKKIKLNYDTEAFSEDDIIKKIEAGNVSLPLKSNLIQGAQSLFGLKTELQFGHLRLTAIASQQQSEQTSMRIENGSAIQEFVLTPAEYDENRHFFLSHYNRNSYENNLANLPQINTAFRIIQLEVWISDDRPTYQENSTQILALTDLGTGDPTKFTNQNNLIRFGPDANPSPNLIDPFNNLVLPDNRVNPIYDFVDSDDATRDIDKASSTVTGAGFQKTVDFETFTGRKLNSSEYTYNEKLGFISLNVRLRPNQQLAVAYKYRFTTNPNEIYTVGEVTASTGIESSSVTTTTNITQDTVESVEPPKVIFTKLIKGTQQRIDLPTWDLMMKNVYSLRANQVNQEDFTFDIFFENDLEGTLNKYIPEEGFITRPLLQELGLDRLNEYNDPQPDGIFDYVPGVTIIPRNGAIIFPKLEPFGSALDEILGPEIAERYKFQTLYDSSITLAQQKQELNKFRMIGEVKSASSGEISLGPFVPEGSVTVRAGGILLVEGRDYEVDYSIGRLRIINDAYLQQGTPIDVNFENQALFSLQQKTMLGLRADYELNKKINLGATFLKLKERPFTEKPTIGNDPINNKIFGLDFTYSSEVPWITKVVDKLPFYSTKDPSAVNFTAEGAYLMPGHSSADVGDEEGGVVGIEDFEGAISGLFLGGFNSNAWTLASAPSYDSDFPEATFVNDLRYGSNRALLNWYVMDRGSRNSGDQTNAYTRVVDQRELFERETEVGQSELLTFDLSYYPEERGPYNFDLPGGYSGVSKGVYFDNNAQELRLEDPASRWGGIMRYFQNPNFEAANYEFIEFWMLNPFMDRPDGEEHVDGEKGQIIINLGNISEDIVKDNYQFFENSLPLDGQNSSSIIETNWGVVPLSIPVANGFDIDKGDQQDLGFDGLTDSQEGLFYEDYLRALDDDPLIPPLQNVLSDPANDNYEFVREDETTNLLTRYKTFNNPQGNAPVGANKDNTVALGNRFPDSEDLNNNRSLDEGEGYYIYNINIHNLNGEIDTLNSKHITQTKTIKRENAPDEKWYRFRIPISQFDDDFNINGFRSIQFMRMYMKGFESAKTFRLGEFQILRNLWRKSENSEVCDVTFAVDEVGLQENSNKQPINYISPPDIQQERLTTSYANLAQDEKAMALVFDQMGPGCEGGINKVANLDLNLYERLQLYTHLEKSPAGQEILNGDMSVFIRFGKDLVNNYYEYEIPLVVSDPNGPKDRLAVWPEANKIDVAFASLKQAKIERIENNVPLTEIYSISDPENPEATIRVKGSPAMGYIKIFEIGFRNNQSTGAEPNPLSGEIWVNELRAVGLNEKGGYAAQARMQIQMADLGEINLAGSYSSIGWGALDQSLTERNRESLLQYDIATNLQLGKFFGEDFGLNLPFYAQYSKNVAYQQFEPYEGDLTPDEKIDALTVAGQADPEEVADIKDRSKKQTTIKTYNFTNVKKQGKGKMPWSINNLSANYSYTETNSSDALIKDDISEEYDGGINYNYSVKPKYIEPFKKVKSKQLKIIKEINFNFIPNRYSFSTSVNRLKNSRTFRLPDEPVYLFDNKRFFWDRNYGLDWDLTKALNFNYAAKASSVVDELRQTGIDFDPADRDWVDEEGNDVTDLVVTNPEYPNEYRNDNIKDLGRSKNYEHNLSVNYTLPIRYLPYMDWVIVKADYKANYNWTAGSLVEIDAFGNTIGNIIQNGQTRSLKGNLNFDKLYAKSSYLKRIESGSKSKKTSSRSKAKSRTKESLKDGKDEKNNKEKDKKSKKDGPRDPSIAERIIVRPLLAIRSINLTYREDLGTVLPGFTPSAELFGMSSGFAAPGWGFAAGLQPNLDNYLNSNEDWFNQSFNYSEQITQNERQTIDLRIALEPIRDLDIDLDFSKSYMRNHSEEFRYLEEGGSAAFQRIPLIDVGSFEATHWGLSTMFENNLETYQKFLDNRVSVSNILGAGDDRIHSIDSPEYSYGYGPESSEVIVPSFLAAYTGKSTGSVTKDLQGDVSKLSYIPKPNWTINYDGLSKMDMFKDILASFSLRHAYRSTLGVNRFNTSLDYQNQPNSLNTNDNYYAEIEIPAVAISEQFAPLIGISMKTKKDFTFELEYRKTRQLQLSLQELSERLSSEVRFGMGYIIKNFRGDKADKKRTRGRKAQEDSKDEAKQGSLLNRTLNSNKVNNNRGKTLTFNLDFSLSDNVEYIYKYSTESPPQPNSGSYTIQIAPNVVYDINENFAMRFFVNYNDRRAKATVSVPRTLDIRAGATAQLKIN